MKAPETWAAWRRRSTQRRLAIPALSWPRTRHPAGVRAYGGYAAGYKSRHPRPKRKTLAIGQGLVSHSAATIPAPRHSVHALMAVTGTAPLPVTVTNPDPAQIRQALTGPASSNAARWFAKSPSSLASSFLLLTKRTTHPNTRNSAIQARIPAIRLICIKVPPAA